MTVSFFKLHVAGDDFVLVDRTRAGHEELLGKAEMLPHLAAAMLDRRRGVGGNALICAGGPSIPLAGTLPIRIFLQDGNESYTGGDAYLCAARWAFDSGRGGGGKVRLAVPAGERLVSALDSRSSAVELPAPRPFDEAEDSRLELLLDGLSATAYLLDLERRWAVTVGGSTGPGPKRVRRALHSAVPEAEPVVVRPVGRDLIRFIAPESADRVGAAAVAVAAAVRSGRADRKAVAEWRGRGAAVSFADFGPRESDTPKIADSGPGALIDRGRFYVEWNKPERVLVAGIAEYAFEGNFDFFE